MSSTNEFGQSVGSALPGWRPPPFPERATIQGSHCRLEPLDPKLHGRGLFLACAADRASPNWTYLPYGPFDSFEDYESWLEKMAQGRDPHFYTIFAAETDHPVGLASYLRIAPENGSIEVGHLHFSERLQRTVAATEAMVLMMQWAFESGYRRYEWKCDALNQPSRRAAQRLGLSFEGIFRQATVHKERNRDTAWFAAIDADWPSIKTAFAQWLDPQNFDSSGRQKVSLSSLTHPIQARTSDG